MGNLILKRDLLSEYLASARASRIELDFYETTIEACVRYVLKRVCAFGILVVDDLQKSLLENGPSGKELSCLALDLGSVYLHLSRNHPLAQRKRIAAKRLKKFPLIRLKEDAYAIFSNQELQKEDAHPRFAREIAVNHYACCLQLIKSGEAYMLGNRWQISELEKMGIQSVRSAFFHKLHLTLIRRADDSLSTPAQNMLRLFCDSYGIEGEIAF